MKCNSYRLLVIFLYYINVFILFFINFSKYLLFYSGIFLIKLKFYRKNSFHALCSEFFTVFIKQKILIKINFEGVA